MPNKIASSSTSPIKIGFEVSLLGIKFATTFSLNKSPSNLGEKWMSTTSSIRNISGICNSWNGYQKQFKKDVYFYQLLICYKALKVLKF